MCIYIYIYIYTSLSLYIYIYTYTCNSSSSYYHTYNDLSEQFAATTQVHEAHVAAAEPDGASYAQSPY